MHKTVPIIIILLLVLLWFLENFVMAHFNLVINAWNLLLYVYLGPRFHQARNWRFSMAIQRRGVKKLGEWQWGFPLKMVIWLSSLWCLEVFLKDIEISVWNIFLVFIVLTLTCSLGWKHYRKGKMEGMTYTQRYEHNYSCYYFTFVYSSFLKTLR